MNTKLISGLCDLGFFIHFPMKWGLRAVVGRLRGNVINLNGRAGLPPSRFLIQEAHQEIRPPDSTTRYDPKLMRFPPNPP